MSVAAMFMAFAGFAQTGQWSVGLNFGYGTEVEKCFLGGTVMYGITDDFDIAGSFNRYFKESFGGVDLKYWDLNADVHWNVLKGEQYKLYPLIGLTYLNGKFSGGDYSDSEGWFGANIGIGGSYDLAENFTAGVELKAQIMENTQFVPMLKLMYKF